MALSAAVILVARRKGSVLNDVCECATGSDRSRFLRNETVQSQPRMDISTISIVLLRPYVHPRKVEQAAVPLEPSVLPEQICHRTGTIQAQYITVTKRGGYRGMPRQNACDGLGGRRAVRTTNLVARQEEIKWR